MNAKKFLKEKGIDKCTMYAEKQTWYIDDLTKAMEEYHETKVENLGLFDVRQRSFVNLYEDSDGSFIGEGRYESFKVAYENRDDLKTYKDTVEVIWRVA